MMSNWYLYLLGKSGRRREHELTNQEDGDDVLGRLSKTVKVSPLEYAIALDSLVDDSMVGDK